MQRIYIYGIEQRLNNDLINDFIMIAAELSDVVEVKIEIAYEQYLWSDDIFDFVKNHNKLMEFEVIPGFYSDVKILRNILPNEWTVCFMERDTRNGIRLRRKNSLVSSDQ